MDKRVIIYQNLAELLDSGVPILRALKTSSNAMGDRYKRMFERMITSISGGASLSEAMSEFPRRFKRLDILVVETGEVSGNLPRTLQLLSDWYGLSGKMSANIRSGMMLPLAIFHFAAFMVPLINQLMTVGFYDFDVPQYFISVIRIIFCFFWLPYLIFKAIVKLTPSQGILRKFMDAVILAIPGLGGGLRYMAISRYCRAFHLFISAGVNGVESARRACDVTGNAIVASWFKGAAESAKTGNPFSAGLSSRLPVMLREQWVVGEETGRLDEMTRRIADSTLDTAERRLIAFATWFPRLVYFAMVIVLGIFVLKMLLSLFGSINML